MKKRINAIALGIAFLAFSALAQDAPATRETFITDPNATYISADPNAQRYEIRGVPYEDRIRKAETYQDLSNIRNEILGRTDLSKDEKQKLFDTISDETTRRINSDYLKQTASIWGKGISGILLETAGYSIRVPVVGDVLVAWGEGLINEDSALDILDNMRASAISGMLFHGLATRVGTALKSVAGPASRRAAERVLERIRKSPEKDTVLTRVLHREANKTQRAILKDIEHTANKELSRVELAAKRFTEGKWIPTVENNINATIDSVVNLVSQMPQKLISRPLADFLHDNRERQEALFEYELVLALRTAGFEVEDGEIEELRDMLLVWTTDNEDDRDRLERVLRATERLLSRDNNLSPNDLAALGILSDHRIGHSETPYTDTFTRCDRSAIFGFGVLAGHVYHDGTVPDMPNGYEIIGGATDEAREENLSRYFGEDSGFSLNEKGEITCRGFFDNMSGFDASLYRAPDGSLVLSFRGTSSLSDAYEDGAQLIAPWTPDQYAHAARILNLLLQNTTENITVVGHSLGGALTQYAMAKNNLEGRVKGYTYNSAGFSDKTIKELSVSNLSDTAANVVNVRNDGDSVSSIGWHIGSIYDVENPNFKSHGIGNKTGTDKDGNPTYDGLLGNLQRDADGCNGECPCGGGCNCNSCRAKRPRAIPPVPSPKPIFPPDIPPVPSPKPIFEPDPNPNDNGDVSGGSKIDTRFPTESERLYNDIWEMGEEYSTPPPPCKCGAACACNNVRRANWEKAYADFKEKQKLAFDRLNREREERNRKMLENADDFLENFPDYFLPLGINPYRLVKRTLNGEPYHDGNDPMLKMIGNIPPANFDKKAFTKSFLDKVADEIDDPALKFAAKEVTTTGFEMEETDPEFADKVQWVLDHAGDLADFAEEMFTQFSDKYLDEAVLAIQRGSTALGDVKFKRALTYAEAADIVKKIGKGINVAGKGLQFITAEDKWRSVAEISMGTLFGVLSGGNPIAETAGEFIGGWLYDLDPVGNLVYDPLIFNRKWSEDFFNWLYEVQYGKNPHFTDEFYEKVRTDYEGNEGKALNEAANKLAEAYNSGCDCPDKKTPLDEIDDKTNEHKTDDTGKKDPPPQIILPPQQNTDTDEPGWREKHPIWAFILDNVVPEVIHIIVDILTNGPYTIETLFQLDENGLPVIVDGIPQFNPSYDGPPIVIHPGTQGRPTFPDPGDWTDYGDVILTSVEVILFPMLEDWLSNQIGDLTQKYPVIGKIFNALGIDSGSIMDTIRNVWGVLTGPGTLGEKLQQLAQDAMAGLAKMLGNLVEWGIGKLIDWIGNFVDGLFGSSGSDSATVVDGLAGNASPPISEEDAKEFAKDMADAFGETIFTVKPDPPAPMPSPPAPQPGPKPGPIIWDN